MHNYLHSRRPSWLTTMSASDYKQLRHQEITRISGGNAQHTSFLIQENCPHQILTTVRMTVSSLTCTSFTIFLYFNQQKVLDLYAKRQQRAHHVDKLLKLVRSCQSPSISARLPCVRLDPQQTTSRHVLKLLPL